MAQPQVKNPLLRRYWIEFDLSSTPPWEQLQYPWPPRACGVTAYSVQDALALATRRVFRTDRPPRIARIVKDVDLGALHEAWEVARAMAERGYGWPLGVPVWRGVWYPDQGPEER